MNRYFITFASGFNRRLDAIGIALSGLCAVHCLAMPLLLTSGVLMIPDRGTPYDPSHLILFTLAGPVSLFALWRGYRHHRALLPLLLGVVGVVLLSLGLLQSDGANLARPLTLTGAALLAAMHLYNWRRHSQAHTTHMAPESANVTS